MESDRFRRTGHSLSWPVVQKEKKSFKIKFFLIKPFCGNLTILFSASIMVLWVEIKIVRRHLRHQRLLL